MRERARARTPAIRSRWRSGVWRSRAGFFKSATSETRATEDGFVTDELLEFYEPMVRAGTPLIVTGNLYVSLQGKSAGWQAAIDDDDKLPACGSGSASRARTASSSSRSSTTEGAPDGGSSTRESGHRCAVGGGRTAGRGRPRALRTDELAGVVEALRRPPLAPRRLVRWRADPRRATGTCSASSYAAHQPPRRRLRRQPEQRMRLLVEVLTIRGRVGDDFRISPSSNGTDMLPLRRGATTEELVAVASRCRTRGWTRSRIRAHYESWPGIVLGQVQGVLARADTRGPRAARGSAAQGARAGGGTADRARRRAPGTVQ